MLLKLKIAPRKYREMEHLQTDLDKQSKSHQRKDEKRVLRKHLKHFPSKIDKNRCYPNERLQNPLAKQDGEKCS